MLTIAWDSQIIMGLKMCRQKFNAVLLGSSRLHETMRLTVNNNSYKNNNNNSNGKVTVISMSNQVLAKQIKKDG